LENPPAFIQRSEHEGTSVPELADATLPAKERIVSFLLHIAERSDAEEGLAFDLPMSRQDIADYLGLTIETVCRMLSELKRERVIAIPSVSQIVLNDMDALSALAEGAE
jgi:CRP-like cAMP-binding protein